MLAWGVAGASGDGWSPGALGNWVGLALLGMFVVEVIVVGGSAVRGMLRAGDRGERLAGPDVGLFPPGRPRGDAESDDGA